MVTIQAEITLKNAADKLNYERGLIKEQDVRSVTVMAVVYTGTLSLIISEELRQKLGLAIKGEEFTLMAFNGQRVSYNLTEEVEIRLKDRYSSIPAVVIPGAANVLLGAIPLENMDLIVNPVTQELAPTAT